MSLYTDQDALKFLERIAIALETLAKSGEIPVAKLSHPKPLSKAPAKETNETEIR